MDSFRRNIFKKSHRPYRWFSSSLLLICFLYFFVSLQANAQSEQVIVNAIADTNQIKIGEQFKLDLFATIPKGTKISFPLPADTVNNFELVNVTEIDTIPSSDANQLTLHQQMTLTGFDSGYHVLQPLPFFVERNGTTDTFLTEAMLMSVVTVEVDTTQDIRAIKAIMDVPFPWMEYLLYVAIAWVIAAIALYIYNKYFRKKKVKEIIQKVPDRPAHEIALEGLRRIEEEKLWQQGLTKKYHSEVTDVVRQYIERRFEINAMEQTTDDILTYFDREVVRTDEKEKLQYMLKLADMVKFAKVQPLPSENETTLQYAFSFVNNTRPVIREDFEKKEEMT